VVTRLPWATPVWLSGSGLGVGGRGWVSARRRPSLSLDLFISLQRKQNKSGVLLVFYFLAPGLCVNFSLVGKQSLVSVTTELKLFPTYSTLICHVQVSMLAPNVPAMYEMHFVVLMAKVVLNTINSRLDAKNIATILWHSKAKVFFVDYQYVQVEGKALQILVGDSKVAESSIPLVIVIDEIDSPTNVRLGELEYEQLIHEGNPRYVHFELEDEWDPIALNHALTTARTRKEIQ
jgi:hypothetical protein